MVRRGGGRGVDGMELCDEGLGVRQHLLLEGCKEGAEVVPGLETIGWLPAVDSSGAASLWAKDVHREDVPQPDPRHA